MLLLKFPTGELIQTGLGTVLRQEASQLPPEWKKTSSKSLQLQVMFDMSVLHSCIIAVPLDYLR